MFLTTIFCFCFKVKTKTVKETIEFYYDWKKTTHYKEWKKNYIADERESPCIYAE